LIVKVPSKAAAYAKVGITNHGPKWLHLKWKTSVNRQEAMNIRGNAEMPSRQGILR